MCCTYVKHIITELLTLCVMHVYCLYISHYPAWAHARLLRRRAPVVVVAGGRVVAHASSRHLRDIRIGDRADRVEQLSPEAIIRVRDTELERACWDDVLREVNGITPFIAQSAPPFLYFSGARFADVRALALRLRARMGRGENRSAAQLAAIRSVEGNVIQLRPRRWAAFLRRFDVNHLAELDFSDDMLEQLRLFGYTTLGDILSLTERQLGSQFGPDGRRLFEMVHPDSDGRIALYTPLPSIEEWHEFEDSVALEPGILEPVIRDCIDRACKELGGYRCQRVQLGLQLAHKFEPRWEGRVLSIPRNRPDTLFRLIAPLLQDLLLKLYGTVSGDSVMGIGVRFESLRHPSIQQAALFEERPAVQGAVRGVHRRYPGSVRQATIKRHVLFEEDEVVFNVLQA